MSHKRKLNRTCVDTINLIYIKKGGMRRIITYILYDRKAVIKNPLYLPTLMQL